jgi:NADH:ubiquinone oxidoreductase subunit C
MSTAARYPYPTGRQEPHPDLAKALAAAVEQVGGSLGETKTDVDVRIPVDRLRAFIETLRQRTALSFDFLRNIAGVDYGEEGMALKYHFYSFRHGHSLQVTVALPPHHHPHPVVPSISDIYPAANWHEREAAEMFGIDFAGHPNLKNLLLEEDLHIHPLLKAHPLQKMELKQGIEEGPAGFPF